jgi:hypothetical protein
VYAFPGRGTSDTRFRPGASRRSHSRSVLSHPPLASSRRSSRYSTQRTGASCAPTLDSVWLMKSYLARRAAFHSEQHRATRFPRHFCVLTFKGTSDHSGHGACTCRAHWPLRRWTRVLVCLTGLTWTRGAPFDAVIQAAGDCHGVFVGVAAVQHRGLVREGPPQLVSGGVVQPGSLHGVGRSNMRPELRGKAHDTPCHLLLEHLPKNTRKSCCLCSLHWQVDLRHPTKKPAAGLRLCLRISRT